MMAIKKFFLRMRDLDMVRRRKKSDEKFNWATQVRVIFLSKERLRFSGRNYHHHLNKKQEFFFYPQLTSFVQKGSSKLSFLANCLASICRSGYSIEIDGT